MPLVPMTAQCRVGAQRSNRRRRIAPIHLSVEQDRNALDCRCRRHLTLYSLLDHALTSACLSLCPESASIQGRSLREREKYATAPCRSDTASTRQFPRNSILPVHATQSPSANLPATGRSPG